MRTLLVLAVLVVAGSAAADVPVLQVSADQVIDLGGVLGKSEVESALTAPPVTKAAFRCAGAGNLIGWIVFQNGKVAQAEVGGSTDRAFEKCVAAALRTARLASKSRVVATLDIGVPVRAVTDRNRGTLDGIVEAKSSLAKFKGVNAPPAERPVVVGVSDAFNTLSREDIDNTIKARAGAIRTCYQKELVATPTLAGKIVVKLEIAGDGRVTAASTAGSTLTSAPVTDCVVSVIKSLRFPAKGTKTTVSYPFLFSQGG